ncbi:MAG: hypothetical protein ACPGSL_10480 [Vicingaceae bacterium]
MKRLSLILLLVLPTLLISQEVKTAKDFDVETGSAYPVVDAKFKEYFHHNNEILSVKVGRNLTFQKFDPNSLIEKSKNEIIIEKNLPRGFHHEEFVQQNGKIFQFYSVWDKPNLTEQFYVHEINFNNPTIENTQLIIKIKNRVKKINKKKITISQSFDKTKYLLTYQKHPDVKNDRVNKDKIGMIVFDVDMKPIWNKEITMPYTEKVMDNLGYTIDSKGNAYVLAKVRNEENSRLELLSYNNSDSPKVTKIKANGVNFPHGIKLKEGKNEMMYCAGFYGRKRFTNGVYVSVINKDGVITNEQFHDIPLDVINQNVREGKQNRNEKKEEKGKEIGIYELGLDDFKINSDGSLLLLGEVYYVRKSGMNGTRGISSTRGVGTGKSMGRSTSTITYNFLDMFIAKIDASGDLSWVNKLSKSQKLVVSSGGFNVAASFQALTAFLPQYKKSNNYDMSYKYMNTEKYHYLLYLDNLKNLDLPLNKIPKTHSSGKGGFLTAYRIDDSTGDVSKLSLFDLRDVKGIPVYQFKTNRIINTKDDEVLLELYKKKKEDILIKINIK